MSHICPYCENETAGADPCPWCGGSLGVAQEKPKIAPVVIHDKEDASPWPIAAAVFTILVLGVLIFEHKRTEQEVAQMGSTSGPALVVNNHSPLFQAPASSPPQLARVASIKTAVAEPAPKDTAAEDDSQDDPTDDSYDDTPAITPTPVAGPESVELSDVQLATQDDGDGHEIAVGTATIYNPSQYEITDYQFTVGTGGGTYRLDPFTGPVDNPVIVESRSIPPGGRVTVPIISNGIMTVTDQYASKSVTVQANENGVSVSSNVTVN